MSQTTVHQCFRCLPPTHRGPSMSVLKGFIHAGSSNDTSAPVVPKHAAMWHIYALLTRYRTIFGATTNCCMLVLCAHGDGGICAPQLGAHHARLPDVTSTGGGSSTWTSPVSVAAPD